MTQPTVEKMTLLQAAQKAAEIFRWYEQLHAAKPDTEKAKRNAEFAEMLETALSAHLAQPTTADDGNKLPLGEIPEGWTLTFISYGIFNGKKGYAAQVQKGAGLGTYAIYAYGATPAEALRAAIERAQRADKEGL